MGTVNILEACKECETVRSIINVTSDKCYANDESNTGYKEDAPMGGYDPYSTAKDVRISFISL